MYIRQTKIGSKSKGGKYTTHRLVECVYIDGKSRQRTLLNLGANYYIDRQHWPALCQRVEQLLHPQQHELELGPLVLPDRVEDEAQNIYKKLINRSPSCESDQDFQSVNLNRVENRHVRSVGVEHVGLWAAEQLGLERLFESLGFDRLTRASALASIVARIARPGSELATWQWLCGNSGMGELLNVEFANLSLMRLYRASDALLAHRSAIEQHLFDQATGLFDIVPTVTLFDLTNTYFEGQVKQQDKAKHGRSKERRSDCPLLTLGLVLDGSGFVRRSKVFEGNVSEGSTLQTMLDGLHAPDRALVVMDAGVATQDNIAWLRQHGYRYLVVVRQSRDCFDESAAVKVIGRSGGEVELCRQLDEESGEIIVGCRSPAKGEKEKAIAERFATRFEQALDALHKGLSKPRARRRVNDIWQRIGRLQEKSRGHSQHYTIEVATDESGERATAVTWQRTPVADTLATNPGVYALRSNVSDWDDETLWRTYTTLTDLEAVFRSLKSELGLRPIYHHKAERAEGHLFITVIAYQLVQVIRMKLRQSGDRRSWSSLRRVLETHCRITTVLELADGRTVHIRQSSRAEREHQQIYDALGVSHTAGRRHRLTV